MKRWIVEDWRDPEWDGGEWDRWWLPRIEMVSLGMMFGFMLMSVWELIT